MLPSASVPPLVRRSLSGRNAERLAHVRVNALSRAPARRTDA
jgi:hypothetical protein